MILLCSTNDFHIQYMIFISSTNDIHCQQMTFVCCTFSKKSIYSAIRNLCSAPWVFSNFKYAFKEMKFIKLKSFTFSKPNLDVTSYTSKSIQQNERSGLYFLAFFERLCLRVKFSFFFFAIPLVNELMTRTGMGVEAWSHACGQGCCMNIAMTYSYFFSWGLQQNVLLVFLLMV